MRIRTDPWEMRSERGMTVAELAIVLAITAVLSLFMGTELQAMADRVYLDTAVAEVVGDLRYARNMAVRYHRRNNSGHPGMGGNGREE